MKNAFQLTIIKILCVHTVKYVQTVEKETKRGNEKMTPIQMHSRVMYIIVQMIIDRTENIFFIVTSWPLNSIGKKSAAAVRQSKFTI